MPDGLHTDETGVCRCAWGASHPLYIDYHDQEWGRPVADDARLFEKICLEGFQSGLSWLTILKKRPAFRAAFAGFDIETVAEMGDADVTRLLADPGIVRHRGKIEATLNNARCARRLREEHGSLTAFFWRFEPPRRGAALDRAGVQGTSKESTALSKELKARGWRFVGPTTVYAFMQAMGLVNDHLDGCHAWIATELASHAFTGTGGNRHSGSLPLRTSLGTWWIDDFSTRDTRVGVDGVETVCQAGPESTYRWSLDQQQALEAAAQQVGARVELLVPGGWRLIPGESLPGFVMALQRICTATTPTGRMTAPL